MIKNLGTSEIREVMVQFIKFGIVGLSNTLIYLLIYYILIYMGIQFIIASTVGFVVSVCNAYILNKRFVFSQDNNGNVSTFGKVILSYGCTYLISTFLLYFFVSIILISKLIAPILNLIITIPLNFLLNKYWAFK